MGLQIRKIVSLSFVAAVSLWSQTVSAQDGATLFKPCAACHSIGGGKMVGPDLKGVTKKRSATWLVSFIQSPAKMLATGDADAKALFKEFNNMPMPDYALSADQINQILSFVDGGKAGAVAVDPEKAALDRRVDSILKTNSTQDIQIGNELFNGSRRFANGAASCASCHNATFQQIATGGALAKDLTKAHSRLGGFAGVKGIIATPPFPSMLQTYKNSPLTDDEIAYLQLYLKSTDAQNATEPIVNQTWFVHSALAVGALMAFAISLLYFKRKRKSVNHDIIERQNRHSN